MTEKRACYICAKTFEWWSAGDIPLCQDCAVADETDPERTDPVANRKSSAHAALINDMPYHFDRDLIWHNGMEEDCVRCAYSRQPMVGMCGCCARPCGPGGSICQKCEHVLSGMVVTMGGVSKCRCTVCRPSGRYESRPATPPQ